MRESPLVEEFQAETAREFVLQNLKERFGAAAAKEFAARVNAVTDIKLLARMHRFSVRCADLDQFRDRFPKL